MADLKHKLKKYKAYLQAHPNGDKVFQVLRKLTSLPVSISMLQETGVGKVVNGFRKAEGDIGIYARKLIAAWKELVREAVKLKARSSEEDGEGSARDSGSENEPARESGKESAAASDEEGEEAGVGEADKEETGAKSDGEQAGAGDGDEEESYHSQQESDAEGDHSDRSASEDERVRSRGDDKLRGSESGSGASDVSDAERGWDSDNDSPAGTGASHKERHSRDRKHHHGASSSRREHRNHHQSSSSRFSSSHHSEAKSEHRSHSSEKDRPREREKRKKDRDDSLSGTRSSSHHGKPPHGDRHHKERTDKHRKSDTRSRDEGNRISDSSKQNSSDIQSSEKHKKMSQSDKHSTDSQHLSQGKSSSHLSRTKSDKHSSHSKRSSDSKSTSGSHHSSDRSKKHSSDSAHSRENKSDSRHHSRDKSEGHSSKSSDRSNLVGEKSNKEAAHQSSKQSPSCHRRSDHQHSAGSKPKDSKSGSGADKAEDSSRHTDNGSSQKPRHDGHRAASAKSGSEKETKKDKHSDTKPSSHSEKDMLASQSASNGDSREKRDGDRSLFEAFSNDGVTHAEEAPSEEHVSDMYDDCDDYRDQWIEEGVTDYIPSSLRKKLVMGGRSQSIEDYEEHIERQVGDSCAEYNPGVRPPGDKYPALNLNAKAFKDHSQSPDDYSEYIDKRMKKDCVEYKPGSTKGERSKTGLTVSHSSHAEQSPDDYADYIEKGVKKECVEYKPGSKRINERNWGMKISHAVQSPDDYSKYIEKEVKKECEEYNPGSKKHDQRNRGSKISPMEQSPDDYSEWIEQGMKKECAEYKPGAKKPDGKYPSQDSRKQHHKGGSQSSDDSGDYVDRGVKPDCAKHNPGSIQQEKKREMSKKESDNPKTDKSKIRDSGHREGHSASHRHRDKEQEMKTVKCREQMSDHSSPQHSSVKNHKQRDVNNKVFKLRLDGKCFQESENVSAKDAGGKLSKRPSPKHSEDCGDSPSGDESQPKDKKVKLEKSPKPASLKSPQTKPVSKPSEDKTHRPSSSSKKSSKRPTDAKALMEGSLFGCPDDHSVKVPAKKHSRNQLESKRGEKDSPNSHSSSSKSRDPKTSSDQRSVSKDCVKGGSTSPKPSENSPLKSSRDRSRCSSKDKTPKSDSSSKPKENSHQRSGSHSSKSSRKREASPDEEEAMASFEDFLNYDEAKAVKKKKADKPLKAVTGTAPFGLPVPAPLKQVKLTEADILSSLPETSVNYRPRRPPPFEEDSRHRMTDDFVDPMQIGTKNKSASRTHVYSGRRHGPTEVRSLFDLSTQVLIDNIDAIDYVGGIPYDVLKPVIDRATAAQLYNLEDHNPHFLEDTDHLWKIHCEKDFRGCEPDEMETWRELYLRKHDEREAKYQKLRDNMSKVMVRGQTGRKVCMAYMDTVAKPPRDVRRQQLKYGTAGIVRGGQSASSSSSSSLKHKPYAPMKHQGLEREERHSRPFIRPMAPMMQKTLKMMKKIRH